MAGSKKTTGISVYTEQWARWSEFKKKYQMYSGTDLLALALILRNQAFFMSQKRAETLRNLGFRGIVQFELFERVLK